MGVLSIKISDTPSLRCVAPQDFFKITVVRGLDHNWDICQYFVSSRPFWNSKNLPRFGIFVVHSTNREVTKGALIIYRLGGRGGGACGGGLWLRRGGELGAGEIGCVTIKFTRSPLRLCSILMILLINSQLRIVPRLCSVSDDWSFLRSPWKPCVPTPQVSRPHPLLP